MQIGSSFVDPKLARGLVRQELRPIHGMKTVGAYQELVDHASDIVAKEFKKRNGKIPTQLASRLRKQLDHKAKSLFGPIKGYDIPTSILPYEGERLVDSNGFLYWLSSEQEVYTDWAVEQNTPDYSSEMLELRFHRTLADRRSVILDDYFCNLMVSPHALVRMIERSGTTKTPVADISANIEEVVTYASMMCMAYTKFESSVYPQVIIPFGDGAFLGKVVIVNEILDQGHHLQFRTTLSQKGLQTTTPPFSMYFTKKDPFTSSTKLIYISSFISKYETSNEQEWAISTLSDLYNEEKSAGRIRDYRDVVIVPDAVRPSAPDNITSLMKRMGEICRDSRWKIATAKRFYG